VKTALKWFPAQVQEVRIWSLPIAYAKTSRFIVVPRFDCPCGLYLYLKLVARFHLGHLGRRKRGGAWRQHADAKRWARAKMREAQISMEGMFVGVLTQRCGAVQVFVVPER